MGEDPESGPGLLESVWRFRRAVLASVLIASFLGFGISKLQPVRYEAVAELILADPRTSDVFPDSESGDASRYIQNQAQRINSIAVAQRASELLGGRLTAEQVKQRVEAQPSEDFDLISVRATDDTGAGAAALANAVAEAYQALVRQDVREGAQNEIDRLDQVRSELQSRIMQAEATLAQDPDNFVARAERDAALAERISIENQAEEIRSAVTAFESTVQFLDPAQPPDDPAQPRPARNAATAALLVLVLSSGVAWWRAEQVQRAEARDDPARVLGAPLLGDVPDFGSLGTDIPVAVAPRSPAAEAFQFILSSLLFAREAQEHFVVLLTSAAPADGKTATVVNLGLRAQRDGRRVLLVDADVRARGLSRLAGFLDEPGLTDLMANGGQGDLPVQRWSVSEDLAIDVTPAGSPLEDPGRSFWAPKLAVAMSQISEGYDLVLIDSSPLLAVADAFALISHADGVVLVVDRGTPMSYLADVKNKLDGLDGAILGYVFNRSDQQGKAYGQYGDYGDQPEPTGRWGSLRHLLPTTKQPSALRAAERDAVAVRAGAEKEVARLRAEAGEEAASMRENARQQLEAVKVRREEAIREVARLRAEAGEEAARVREQARQQLEAVKLRREEAIREVARLRAEAGEEAARAREQARQQLEAAKARHSAATSQALEFKESAEHDVAGIRASAEEQAGHAKVLREQALREMKVARAQREEAEKLQESVAEEASRLRQSAEEALNGAKNQEARAKAHADEAARVLQVAWAEVAAAEELRVGAEEEANQTLARAREEARRHLDEVRHGAGWLDETSAPREAGGDDLEFVAPRETTESGDGEQGGPRPST